MFFFVTDNNDLVLVGASEATVRKFWTNYWMYRYDFNFSFYEFLKENGIAVRKVSPRAVSLSDRTIDIEICPN